MRSHSETTCYAEVASLLGANFRVRHVVVGKGLDRRRIALPALEARISGVAIHCELAIDSQPSSPMTRLTASLPGTVGLSLSVYRNFSFPQYGRIVDRESLVVGNPFFDRNFVVRSKDAHYARLWLSPEVQEQMLAAKDFCFEVADERVTATSHRSDDPKQLYAAILALSKLGSRAKEVEQSIQSLAQRLGSSWTPAKQIWLQSNPPEFRFDSARRTHAVSICHGRTGGRRGIYRLLTRLWCRRLSSRSDRFVVYSDSLGRKDRPASARRLAKVQFPLGHPPGYHIHASNPERLQASFTAPIVERLLRLSPLALFCTTGAVEIVWPGAKLRPELLRDGAEFCGEFAVEKQIGQKLGPYR